MLKLTAVVSLMLIATWSHADSRRHKKDAASSGEEPGSTLWAASLSCESCGKECAAACGTRHFRSCCFNYLRRKRGDIKWTPNDMRFDNQKKPVFIVEEVPEPWISNIVTSDLKPYTFDETLENRLFDV